MQQSFEIATDSREELIDITSGIKSIVKKSSVNYGIVQVYVRGATAAIMIQENWDNSVQTDVINLMQKIAPRGVWLHDRQDGNGDSHLKAGLIGPSESIPIIDGKLGLSTWQNVFLCEFDGPRNRREIVVTITNSEE
ncbi:MAG: secondary thiamine-phosphate synthase enzyme YjbQ [Candidatus Woesearchaeota archaeon]